MQSLPEAEPAYAYGGGELETLAGARNYYQWIVSLCEPYVGENVLEIGAGLGTFASALLANDRSIHLTLTEPAHNLKPLLQRRFASDPRVRVVDSFDPAADVIGPRIDTALLINVLEHIDDAHGMLNALREKLRPSGRLILFVPAGGAALFGSLDVAFDHHRRFTATSLNAMLSECGFTMVESRYLNSLGIAPWFVLGRVLRLRTLPDFMVRAYDRVVIPVLRRVEQHARPRFGQSLFVVATPSL